MLLLTAFEPFDRTGLNASQEALTAFMSRYGRELPVAAAVLPVEYEADVAAAWSAVEDVRPRVLLHLGQARRQGMSVERVGINLKRVRGEGTHQVILEGAPAAYFTTLPGGELLAALQEERVPAHSSGHAGTYLCNHILFRSLHRSATEGLDIEVGFLHLPLLPTQARQLEGAPPSMELEVAVRGLRAAVERLARRPAPVAVRQQGGSVPAAGSVETAVGGSGQEEEGER